MYLKKLLTYCALIHLLVNFSDFARLPEMKSKNQAYNFCFSFTSHFQDDETQEKN